MPGSALQFARTPLQVPKRQQQQRRAQARNGRTFSQMRITCPNCGAQYDVPDEAIPAVGRDVECSACDTSWFFVPPVAQPERVKPSPEVAEGREADAPDAGPGTEAPPAPQPKRDLDPSVAEILREEADRERAARKADALEVQTDLNLPPTAASAFLASPESVPQDASVERALTAVKQPATPGKPASRRDLLPDIEEINSTLRSTTDRDVARGDLSPDAPMRGHQRRSFRRGTLFAFILAACAAAVYVFAPDLSQRVPEVEPYLSEYVRAVDAARVWLETQAAALIAWAQDTLADLQQE